MMFEAAWTILGFYLGWMIGSTVHDIRHESPTTGKNLKVRLLRVLGLIALSTLAYNLENHL